MSKFDSALAEWLYDLTMVTGQDDDANDGVLGGAWYALFVVVPGEDWQAPDWPVGGVGAILAGDRQGFVGADVHTDRAALDAHWAAIVADCDATMSDETSS